jgi:[acyl-carrier-protein] S-malonyltransferase
MFAAGREVPGTMAAVLGLPGDAVARVCAEVATRHGVVVPANYNSEGQVVISGEVAAVRAAEEPMKAAGARRFAILNVSGAFHSPLLEGAAAGFRTALGDVAVADAEVPLVANVTAAPVRDADGLEQGFGDQLTSPVLWQDIMRVICGDGPPIVLEVGAGKVLTGLARRAFPEVEFVPVGTREDLAGVLEKIEAAT